MVRAKDMSLAFVCLVIFVVLLITVSHVLIIYNGARHDGRARAMIDFDTIGIPSSRVPQKVSSAESQKTRKELLNLEHTIQELKSRDIPNIEAYRKLLRSDIYGHRIAGIILNASLDSSFLINKLQNPSRNNGDKGDLVTDTGLYKSSSGVDGAFLKGDNSKSSRHVLVPRLPYAGKERPNLDLCPTVPPTLLGKVFVNANHSHNMTRKDVETDHRDLLPGGIWQPPDCVARHRVAIIIPYRDREQHLVLLLSHLLPILKRQQLNFEIFVIEQKGNDTFNKARIMNAAFKEAIKIYDFQCFVFHDVDLLPEDDRNMYSCPQQPRHMSVAIDEMNYKVPYEYLVGGVLSMRTEHFQKVNGYSNLYWGWGAEDDDMAFRIMHVGLKITRPPSMVARYKMIKHEKRKPTDWRKRTRLLRTGTRRFNFDGLNSVNYDLISIKKERLFTHILVEIGKPPGVS